MGLEDKELGDDLLAVHFFMEKDGSCMMFEAEHVISRSDIIQDFISYTYTEKLDLSWFYF